MQAHLISVALVLTIILQSAQSDEVYCEEPPIIEFTNLEEEPSEQYPVGTIINYSCRLGYTKRGRSGTLECKISGSEESAEWTLPQFSCTPQSCGDPGYVNNGRRIGSLFTFPNSVKYECKEGYKIKGLPTRYCQPSGEWSGRLPLCEDITCTPPENLANGYVTYRNLEFGSEIKFKCDKGYRLNTEERVFCTSNGKWSNTNVQCIESVCDMPESPKYGSVQIIDPNSKLLSGSIVLYSCNGNRIANGPTTAKCLETGEWTFPTPNCLEPCQIPYLTNGIVGSYVKKGYSNRRVFKEKTLGSKVKNDEILYIRCSDGYEVSGSEKIEETVSCTDGKWSHELQCEPASCCNQPPSVQNAQAVDLNPVHGGKVFYQCDEGFKKIENENIFCDYGIWKGGNRPVCKNTRCFVDQLVFPGLIKGRKTVYRDGESFEIECNSGYQVINASKREIRCKEGIWNGPLPPCVAASCVKPPPKIDHGQAEARSTFHTSTVNYICEDPYVLDKNNKVQCLFGKWEGQLPKCKDSRCYLNNLQNSAYVDLVATDSVTLSGYELNVVCKEGYSPSQLPICLKGEWSRNSWSPCKENDCSVPILYHGDIKRIQMGDYYWNWRYFRYDKQVDYVKISAGTVLPYSSSVILFCHANYFFQGSSVRSREITCTKGKWMPDPVCLRFGQRYIPQTTTQKPSATTLSIITEHSKRTTTSKHMLEIDVTTEHKFTLKEVYETVTSAVSKLELPEDEYYCEYPINDENLIAHADGKKLRFHDKVKNSSVVVFRCKHVGYHHLNGIQNIKCEANRMWHSSEFPTCSEPTKGNAVIIFDKTLNVSIDGNLEARKGQDITFMCVAVESNSYPYWSVPTKNNVRVKRERVERESFGDILYVTHLAIENMDVENEGPYGCAIENNTINIVNLVVNDPDLRCPEIPDVVGVSVSYDFERRVKSRAVFSCIKPGQEINGEAVLTCKNNGEWSDVFPECSDIKCRELKGKDLLLISYTNDRNIGSKATFHCFGLAQRSGASFADCLENGTWSNPTPICRTSPCDMENILSALPVNVIPDVNNMNNTVPYNTTVKLTCSGDLIAVGDHVARCNSDGEWVYGNIQCISGCPELAKDLDSIVTITPNKDIYKLGDIVTFSCPPGMSLTTESQLIMCLKHGWSETILPDCQQKIK